ncbi:Uncharacterised protein [Enterobacter cancerogenus]|uniref:Uncharacterized protein n=1 Tax=Enterobacter cancerogenus TaxID=69218 RepID=A0A484ZB32_9ENTR|nr:Uncharacterised protein [Enterobacter cancerogenus]
MRWFTPLWSKNRLNASAVVANPFGTETPMAGQVCNHFTQGGIFASNSVYIIHAELVIPKHQR